MITSLCHPHLTKTNRSDSTLQTNYWLSAKNLTQRDLHFFKEASQSKFKELKSKSKELESKDTKWKLKNKKLKLDKKKLQLEKKKLKASLKGSRKKLENRLEQATKMRSRGLERLEEISLDHGEESRSSELDDQAQQQDSQVAPEAQVHQKGSLDSRLGHNYDAYSFDHRVSDDEVMDDIEYEEEHDPDTPIDHDSFEYGRGSHSPQLDNQVEQQDYQDYPEEVQDSGSEDGIAAYNSRLRVIAEHNDYDDEGTEHEADHESATLGDVDEEMNDGEIKFWLNRNGDLDTHTRSYHMVVILRELNAAWAPQKQEFIVQATVKRLNWPFMELEKESSKCMRTTCSQELKDGQRTTPESTRAATAPIP
jgi:hypothetical protein